uniref:Uncharacterized protein n=1 Tax=Arundo donax TaxID=35708 RepID=A0A0A9HZG6_ARUDO
MTFLPGRISSLVTLWNVPYIFAHRIVASSHTFISFFNQLDY